MNVQERLRKLENYAAKKEENRLRKMEETLRKEEEMIKQIKSLEPRIQDLILVANSCLSHNIPLENREWGFWIINMDISEPMLRHIS